MTSKDFRTIIEYNNLQTIADDLQVTEQYKILLKGIQDGKTTIDIAKELDVSRSRVDQMSNTRVTKVTLVQPRW